MIVNHTTGQQTSERAVLRLFHAQVAADNPRIGVETGVRGPWSSPPTDQQLRSALPKHSITAETDRPPSATGSTYVLIDDVWTQQWSVPIDEQLRAQIVAQIKQAASDHILAVLPEWKQANMTARAVELAEIRESREMTAEESAEHQALHAAWAWVRSVRTASDVAEADVAAMDRAQLEAWTMPALPEWPA